MEYLGIKVKTDIDSNVNTKILEPTRNLYMKNDTMLYEKANKDILENRLNRVRRFADENALPKYGINVGHMPNSTLAYNPVDIESELYGINLLNAKYQTKKRKYDFTPRVKNLKQVSFYEKPEVFIPEPLIIEKNQRPIIP